MRHESTRHVPKGFSITVATMNAAVTDDPAGSKKAVARPTMSEDAEWASGLGGQLRLVQASFADDDAATRQQYLSEEIARALKTVPPTKRRAYLQALAERFPAWEGAPAVKESARRGFAPGRTRRPPRGSRALPQHCPTARAGRAARSRRACRFAGGRRRRARRRCHRDRVRAGGIAEKAGARSRRELSPRCASSGSLRY